MEVIASLLKEDSGKGHTIVEGNRAAVNAPVLEVLSLTRRFGEHTAVDSLTVAGLSQMLIIYSLAWLLGVDLNWNPLALAGVLCVVILGAALFSTLSLIIASVVKTRERFMGIGQVLTMPLFFASNAIYPASIMPFWLQTVAHANPLTYEVDALRALMLMGGASSFGLVADFSILLVAVAIMVMIGGKLYPRVAT